MIRNIISQIVFLIVFITIPIISFAQCISGDCLNGFGVKFHADSTLFRGQFENGMKKMGTYEYKNGDSFEGNFVKNLRTGFGVYTYKNGDQFRGEFVEDHKVFGKYTYANGNEYEGGVVENQPNGYGILKEADGKIIEGEWKNGKILWNALNDTVPSSKNFSDNILPAENKQTKSIIIPRFYCVIVGISDYQGTLSDLQYADKDAIIFYEHLSKAFKKEFSAGKSILLVNGQATASNVKNAMDSIFSEANENDFVLFFFSGHGSPGYFRPYDYDVNSIEHDFIKAEFKKIKARYKICIADACFSGSISNSSSYYSSVSSISDERIAVMMSSRSDQTSQETQQLKQGVFSYYLIKGMKGDADYNHDSYITVGELFVYTQNNVYNYSGGKQVPFILGQNLDRIPLTRLKR
jgi:hypothetical protein